MLLVGVETASRAAALTVAHPLLLVPPPQACVQNTNARTCGSCSPASSIVIALRIAAAFAAASPCSRASLISPAEIARSLKTSMLHERSVLFAMAAAAAAAAAAVFLLAYYCCCCCCCGSAANYHRAPRFGAAPVWGRARRGASHAPRCAFPVAGSSARLDGGLCVHTREGEGGCSFKVNALLACWSCRCSCAQTTRRNKHTCSGAARRGAARRAARNRSRRRGPCTPCSGAPLTRSSPLGACPGAPGSGSFPIQAAGDREPGSLCFGRGHADAPQIVAAIGPLSLCARGIVLLGYPARSPARGYSRCRQLLLLGGEYRRDDGEGTEPL